MSPRLVFAPRDGRPLEPLFPPTDGPVVLVVPGEEVLCRWLELPSRVYAQAASAAAYRLEEALATPRERLHVALGVPDADGVRAVAVVDRERMQAWLDAASAAGIKPSAVVPDCLLLPEPTGDTAIAARLGEMMVVRGERLALTCEADLAPVVMGERAYTVLANAEAARLFADGAAAPAVDLRQGAFAAAKPRAGGSRLSPAVLAVAAALLVLAVPAVTAVRHELAARAALAEVDALGGPGALREELTRLRARERFAGSAAAVLGAVEQVEGMEVRSLLYSEDGTFRISAVHSNYSDIEALKAPLARAGLSLEETNTAAEDGRVLSDLLLRPAS